MKIISDGEQKVILTLHGYLPPSENALRCAHWSVKHREKRRALLALRAALERAAGIESASSPTASGPLTGTTGDSKTFRTALSLLVSCQEMRGISLKDASSLARFTHVRKKKRKSSSKG